MIERLKKLNWSSFIFIFVLCLIGSLSNENYKSITDALIIGGIFGIIFGLMFAIIGRDR